MSRRYDDEVTFWDVVGWFIALNVAFMFLSMAFEG